MSFFRRIINWITTYRAVSVVIFWLGVVLTIFFTAHLLYSSFCAMTWGKFAYKDYGVYTNMIWNSGHGRLFRFGMTDNYLHTHLAFSLALLGPLFKVWNHPFLLSLIQWCMLIAGAWILSAAARKRGLKKEEIAAVIFFFTGYRFTQSVVLSEFHTVSVYFLLVPALYYCLAFRKNLAWLPLILILGVREDAFIFVVPVLLYFSIRDKWKLGYVYMTVAVLYGLAAVFVIYPYINDDLSIMSRRSNYLDPARWHFSESEAIVRRLHAVILTCLPALCFSGRRMYVPLVFSAAGLLAAIFSSWPSQQALGGIYSAPVMVCLVAGLVESNNAGLLRGITVSKRISLMRSFLLIAVTLMVHLYSGFIMWGGKDYEVYQRPEMSGLFVMRAVRHLPPDGTLLTEQRLMGFCSNRARIISMDQLEDAWQNIDVVFMHADAVRQKLAGRLVNMIKDGTFGLYYYDGEYVVLKRGHDTSVNGEFLATHTRRPITIVLSPKHGGSDVMTGQHAFRRYWSGAGHKAPITLSYGGFRWLPAGKYRAVFRYAAAEPEQERCGNWGRFSLYHLNDQGSPVAEEEIPRIPSEGDALLEQAVIFELVKASNIEVRITGGDAELWLDSVIFESADR